VLLLSQLDVTMAETTVTECTSASTKQNYPNLESYNAYEVKPVRIYYVDLLVDKCLLFTSWAQFCCKM